MKAVSCRMSKKLQLGTVLRIIDNSGVSKARIIAVKHYGGVKNRFPRAGIGDIVICSVLSGKPEMKHKIVPVLIVQQKGSFRRAEGTTIRFYQNAGIVLKNVDEGEPQGTIIKEPVAKEVIERFIKVGKTAKVVV
ncbi:50S ribosomal protein L14 [archaeon]|nr:50S ribosomal protein L14 [archaeon]